MRTTPSKLFAAPRRARLMQLAALAGTAMLAVTSCSSSGSASTGGGGAQVGVGYFQSATIGPEVLVAGNSDLADKVDGKIKLTPIDSGVAGLA